jgi:ComF family protein
VAGVRGFLTFLLESLFPFRCLVCGENPERESGSFDRVLCGSCLATLQHAGQTARIGGGDPIPLVSPFVTNDTLLEIIHFLKFEGGRTAARPLGLEMARMIEIHVTTGARAGSVLLPVPLHGTRLAKRGYNQASLLAGVISSQTGIPVADHVLRRKRRTRPQSKLEEKGRKRNVAGAFACPFPRLIEGKDLILVDDLVTTGHTILSCARMLRRHGCASITAVSAGRAGRTLF